MAIKIVESFTGYPDGKNKRQFAVGETPSDLSVEYAELLVTKGHAVRSHEAELRPSRKETVK